MARIVDCGTSKEQFLPIRWGSGRVVKERKAARKFDLYSEEF